MSVSEMPKLTKAQWRRLAEVANHVPMPDMPNAAFRAGATDKKLIALGLIERADHRTGNFTAYLCRLTDAGRRAIASSTKD